MNELSNVFGQPQGAQSFDQIQISIASPERIRSWWICTGPTGPHRIGSS